VEDDKKVQLLFDKRLSQEIEGETLGDEYKGYTFKITGGMDKDGFAMKQGVLHPGRVRLLLSKDSGMYRPKRNGCRVRRSVRGCIVANDISVLNLTISKQGPEALPGLDTVIPRRLGPKRASNIRKLFNLDKKDDVRKYVIRRKLPEKEPKEGQKAKKARSKAPKIQRLITPRMLQHKRQRLALQKKHTLKTKSELQAYKALVAARAESKKSALSKRKSIKENVSVKKGDAKTEKPATKVVQKKVEKKADKPVAKKADKPVEKKADKPVEKKADKPADKKPVEKKQAEPKAKPQKKEKAAPKK